MAEERVVRFDRGTLLVEGFLPGELPEGFVFDRRVGQHRGPALAYAELVLGLHRAKVPFRDEARAYQPLTRPHRARREPRPYQIEAVEAWRQAGRRGLVVLPTGAGKTLVAELAIADARRDVLVIAPTLDLVGQWYDLLRAAFGEPVGVVGGGSHQVEAITVTTYDSAWAHLDKYGDRFGLLVFDEVHHLPGAAYSSAAEFSLAPFRLGLTATLERPDGRHDVLDRLVGPVVYRQEITDLAGQYLADYRSEVLEVDLLPEEGEAYAEARATFRSFCDAHQLRPRGPDGFQKLLRVAARSPEGRAALRAWRTSRRILQQSTAKLACLETLLRRHQAQRCLVFTHDNATAREVSRRFLVPLITHETPVLERRRWLNAFGEGVLPVLVTSRVLNEGVDLPAAEVAIVLSGSATVREHVQRLGRILRPAANKQAVLYELVVRDSAERFTSERRRDHAAWRG